MLVIMAFLIVLLMPGNTSGEIELSAFPKQTMNCNGWTVLQCNISSSVELDNSDQLYWKKQEEKDFKCDPKWSKNPPGFECNYTREALTLTILHSTPANIGTYFCKIMAHSGHGSANINLSLGECSRESSQQTAGPEQMECSFNHVYPDAIINWFHYEENVTSNSTITRRKNSDGTFNISSILNIQDRKESYNCSLWSLRNGLRNVSSMTSTQHCASWTLFALMFSLRISLSL